MATYVELLQTAGNDALRQKVRVACIIAAETVRSELDTVPNHANRLAWAKAVFKDPELEGNRMLWAVLAQNKNATTSAILAATDAVIQTNVDAAVNVFAS